MEEVVENHNENYEIDEDRPSSKISVHGHNNKIVFTCNFVKELVILGHNNYIHGESTALIGSIKLLGHNNTLWNLKVKKLDVLGHNNTVKNITNSVPI